MVPGAIKNGTVDVLSEGRRNRVWKGWVLADGGQKREEKEEIEDEVD